MKKLILILTLMTVSTANSGVLTIFDGENNGLWQSVDCELIYSEASTTRPIWDLEEVFPAKVKQVYHITCADLPPMDETSDVFDSVIKVDGARIECRNFKFRWVATSWIVEVQCKNVVLSRSTFDQ